MFLAAATPLMGQAPTIAPAASVLFHAAEVTPVPGPALVVRDSGAAASTAQNALSVLGGAVGAIGGYALAKSLGGLGGCPDTPGASCDDETPLGWRIGGAVVGGAAGYLVGRGLSGRWTKRSPQNVVTLDAPPEDRGMQWWQGALAGGLIGGVGAPMLVKAFRLDEQGDGVPAIAFAPVGALLGLVIGGSMAQSR